MKSLRELSQEIGKWAEYNFDVYFPHLGFAEEVGEIAHVILKKRQNIRNVANYEVDLRDAIADAGIYLMHWFHIGKQHPVQFEYDKVRLDNSVELIIGNLFIRAGELVIATDTSGFDWDAGNQARASLSLLCSFSYRVGVDFMTQINETWFEVKKRDWRKFPKNGLTE